MESSPHILPLVLLVLVLSPSALAFSPTRVFDFIRGKYETGAAKPWDLSFQVDAPVIPQTGSRAADFIPRLPRQPRRSPVRQYAGYVTIDDKAGKHMFYYFTEVRRNASTLPLVLWLGGGPGCSSVGSAAFLEHGAFLVGTGGRIHKNLYSMNTVGNVIYLDSPIGTGFSYSDTPSAHDDVSTAVDHLRFLVNWLERFPQYKGSRVYLGGSGYAGNYLPQLAQLILNYNKAGNRNHIILRALLLGNPVMDSETDFFGVYNNIESHAMIKSHMKEDLFNFCNGTSQLQKCSAARSVIDEMIRPLYMFDLTAEVCARPTHAAPLNVDELYECREKDVASFLNSPEVQKALHVNPAKAPKVWSECNRQIAENYGDITISALPIYKSIIADGSVRILIYSGDADATVPTFSTRLALAKMNLTGGVEWHQWFTSKIEQSGYNEGFGPILLATMRGAGHKVAKTHGRQLATMIELARNGTLVSQHPNIN